MQRPSGTGNFLNDVTSTGRVVEREALLRWQREDGLIGPDQFLDVAAEAGMLCEIGERVLDVACAQAAAWRRQAALVVPVAVNVAPEQLREPSLVETVTRALARHGVPPDALVLEVTEQGVLADEAVAHEVLTTLRGMGVRIALDDFGTGFSSLSHLARLPVDAIKVDRQFVCRHPARPPCDRARGGHPRAVSVVRPVESGAGPSYQVSRRHRHLDRRPSARRADRARRGIRPMLTNADGPPAPLGADGPSGSYRATTSRRSGPAS